MTEKKNVQRERERQEKDEEEETGEGKEEVRSRWKTVRNIV